LFFGLSSWVLALALFAVILGATAIGHLAGRSKRKKSEALREPFAVVQAALIGFMGLVLAFGINLAVGRLGATRRGVRLSSTAGQALDAAPVATAPRLYVERLNETFDSQSSRVYGLRNRVPTAVLILEVFGAAAALGALALHLATLGRGVLAVLLAAVLVVLALLVTFDLDRPTRGLIQVPDEPLTQLRASMSVVAAASGPTR
jgi:hypothetical protein